jgi:hypothetical protein
MRAWSGLVAGLVLCACAFAIAASAEGAPPERMPVAVVDRELTRVDPLTLAPRGPTVHLPEHHDNWGYSPSGSHVALGMGSPGTPTCGAGLCIVDVDSMQLTQDISAPVAVQAIGWVSPRRIAAVTQLGLVFVADPVTGEVVSQRTFGIDTYLPRSAISGGRFVTLLGGRFLRLVTVDATGRIQVARLGGLGGEQSEPGYAGVTIDPRSPRAFVFAAGPRAAEVDLRTMAVRYHGLGKAFSGDSERPCAAWLGHNRAVAFGDSVRLVDTRRWTTERMRSPADQAAVVGRRLLTYTSRFSESRVGSGLRIYSPDGEKQIAHLFGRRRLSVQVAGSYAYVLDPRKVRIVRVRDGKVVHEGPRRTTGFTTILDARSGGGVCE